MAFNTWYLGGMTAETTVGLELTSIIEALTNLNRDEDVAEFVSQLDRQMASWDFTEDMYAYFKAQHKTFKAIQREEEEEGQRQALQESADRRSH